MKPLVQTLKPFLWSIPATLLCFGAQAAENGLGFYLLGSKGPMAALLPAPGLYLQNDTYFYRASAGASAPLPLGGVVGFGVDAKADIEHRRDAPSDDRFTSRRFVDSCHCSQQRGLSRPVVTDKSDTIPDMER